MSSYQWALTTEFRTIDGGWGYDCTRYFRTRGEALLRVPRGVRGELRTGMAVGDGQRYLLGRVSCPWGECPVCGSTGLWDGCDVHEVSAVGCSSMREPLVGRRVRVQTIDGCHRGYGTIAKRDGYTVLWVRMNGGRQIPVGDSEFELLLPGFSAEGITWHRIGEGWPP